jgi:hypothetical protein
MKINNLIKKSGCDETLEVYRKTQAGEFLGSPIYKYIKQFNLFACVMPTKSQGEVDRIIIDDTPQGTKINTVFQCFSSRVDLKEQDLVKRADGLWYEVRPIKDYKNKIMISHLHFYITLKDAQDVDIQ